MNKERKNLLVFGYGLAAIITFFVVRHGYKHEFNAVSWVFLALAAVLTVITAIDYRLIKPFYEKWMVVAHFIGTVITTIILTVLYYLAFGIPGIIIRLMGKDLLDAKLEPEKASYWKKREGEFNKEGCTKQF